MILYLDVRGAAEATSMSPRWIRQQIRDGLRHYDTGGKLLIEPGTLIEWIRSHYRPTIVDHEAASQYVAELIDGRRQKRKAAR